MVSKGLNIDIGNKKRLDEKLIKIVKISRFADFPFLFFSPLLR